MPEVSVVISTYNRKHMVREALHTALAQRDVDLEVIVVDNGSSDGTADYLDSIEDPRLRVVRNETSKGPTGGRNSGLAAARGTWVGFLDDDDLWEPTKLRRQLDAMAEAGATWSYTGCVYVDARRRVLGGEPPLPPDEIVRRLPRRYLVPGGISSMLWRRDVLDGDGLLDEQMTWATDWDVSLRLSRTGPPAWVPEPMVAYRQHGTNVSKGAGQREHEHDLVRAKFADLRSGEDIALGTQYRFIGSEALRSGHRIAALRAYARAVLAGDLGSLLRALAVFVPTALHGALRRALLSDRDWLARGRAWLDALAVELPVGARVAIVQSRVARYRVAFYEGLRERLADRGVGLDVLHATEGMHFRPDPGALDWGREVGGRAFQVGSRAVVWMPVLEPTKDADLIVVEQASRHLVNLVLLARHVLFRGPPVAFWGHGRSHKADDTWLGEALKRVVSRRAAWFFAYTEAGGEAVRDDVPAGRVTVVRNATDTRALRRHLAEVGDEQRERRLAELGLRGGDVVLFLGHHGELKRFDVLLPALDQAHARCPGLEAVFVGAGELAPEVSRWCAERDWAVQVGQQFDDALAEIGACADVVAVPGWAGLVVVDAFALGLPIVVSEDLPHPPEVAYVEDGVNGLRVRDGGAPEGFATALVDLLADPELRRRLREGARATGADLTIEQMAANFAEGIIGALEAEGRLPAG